MMSYIQQQLSMMTSIDWLSLGFPIVIAILARKLVSYAFRNAAEDSQKKQVIRYVRVSSILLFVWMFSQLTWIPALEQDWFTKIVSIFVLINVGFLFYHLLELVILRKFGKSRDVDGKRQLSETYASRLLGLLWLVLVCIVVLIGFVQILGFNSLLQAGGVLGFLGVLLALTQGAWAPDIISGLVILNSRLLEEGDVIEIRSSPPLTAVVFKTKVFHTEVLDIVNNHRVMLQNSMLRAHAVHNLSRFASAKGLREQLYFNIGYDTPISEVRQLFATVFDTINSEKEQINIETQFELEVKIVETGDYAVKWAVSYYIKDVRNLLKIRQSMLEIILKTATEKKISLATPLLYQSENPISTV